MLILITISGCTMFAQQRMCDQEVICISPSGTVVNGNRLSLRFEMKNHGPDIMLASDTTLYMLYILLDDEQRIVYQGMIAGRSNDTIGIGGSSRYTDNYNISFNYPGRTDTFMLDFCVRIGSWGINVYGDTIRFSHHDPSSDNNTCCSKVTVMPKETTAISNVDEGNMKLLVYPNPAKDLLYLHITDKNAVGDLNVIIRDMTGKALLKRRYSPKEVSDGKLIVNVDQLPSGTYSISLQSAKNTFSQKMSISR